MSRKVLGVKVSTNAAIKKFRGRIHQRRLKKLDRPTNSREAIEDPRTFSIGPPSCQEGVEIMIRYNLRAR